MSRLMWIPEKVDGTVVVAGHYKCTHCGAEAPYVTHSNYCGNCGTRFDKVDTLGGTMDVVYRDEDMPKETVNIHEEDPVEIKVLYHADIDPLEVIEQGDWIDLRCAENVTMYPGESQLISLGVSIQLPEGYEAIVAPRSSAFKHFGITMTNSFGVIDNSYCGPNDIWRFPAYFTRGGIIPKNTRIAQFRIQRNQPKMKILTVDNLANADRGGFGSTGKE